MQSHLITKGRKFYSQNVILVTLTHTSAAIKKRKPENQSNLQADSNVDNATVFPLLRQPQWQERHHIPCWRCLFVSFIQRGIACELQGGAARKIQIERKQLEGANPQNKNMAISHLSCHYLHIFSAAPIVNSSYVTTSSFHGSLIQKVYSASSVTPATRIKD